MAANLYFASKGGHLQVKQADWPFPRFQGGPRSSKQTGGQRLGEGPTTLGGGGGAWLAPPCPDLGGFDFLCNFFETFFQLGWI